MWRPKLASDTIAVGQITTARFIVQCVLMAPVVWLIGLPFQVARKQWLAMLLRATFLLTSTFCFIAAIRVMPLADALAIVFVAPFIVLLVGKFYLKEEVGPRRVGAAAVGFLGVLLVNPTQLFSIRCHSSFSGSYSRWVRLLYNGHT